MNTFNIIGVIPVRGGSKRLPKKNSIDFFGKPLMQYTIEAAIKSKVFNELVVSTEDKDIINTLSSIQGIEIIKRPEKLATDESSVVEVVNHVLDLKGDDYDYVFVMLPSTPLRTYKDIINVKKMLENKKHNGVVSITDFAFPVNYAVNINKAGALVRSFPEIAKMKSQFAPKYYVDNGGIYALKPQFIRENNYFPPDTIPYIMPFWSSIDIDTPEDLEIAKAMYLHFYKKTV